MSGGISKGLALSLLATKAAKTEVAPLLIPTGATAPWGPNDAPILIVMGQSNTYGHGTASSFPDAGLANGSTVASEKPVDSAAYLGQIPLDHNTANKYFPYAGKARYITVRADNWLDLSEIRVYGGGTVISNGSAVYVGPQGVYNPANFPASNLADGNAITFTSSGGYNANSYFVIDMGSVKNMTGVDVFLREGWYARGRGTYVYASIESPVVAPLNQATALTNVYALNRTANSDALYKPLVTVNDIAWEQMVPGSGNHNIGTIDTFLGAGDGQCNMPNQFARMWQEHIDMGNALGLPNLYIFFMGFGGQGMDASLDETRNRWWPDRDPTDVQSLYPRGVRSLRAAMEHLFAQGKNPRVLAMHWNQWEADCTADAASVNAAYNFNKIVAGVNDAIGSDDIPWTFYWPMSPIYGATRLESMRKAITSVVATDPVHRSLMDTRTFVGYTGTSPDYGLFTADNVHYLARVHAQFAKKEWQKVLAGNKGVPVKMLKGRASASQYQDAIAEASKSSVIVNKWIANQYTAGTIASVDANGLSGTTFVESTGWNRQLKVIVEPITGKKVFQPAYYKGTFAGQAGQQLYVFDSTPTDGKYGYVEWDQVGNPCVSICFAVRPRETSLTFANLSYGYFAIWLSSMWNGTTQFPNSGVPKTGTSHDTGTPFCQVWDLANMNPIRVSVFTGTPVNGVYSGTPSLSTTITNLGVPLVTGWPMNKLVRWRAGLLAANNGTLTVEWYNEFISAWVVAVQQRNYNAILVPANNADGGQLGMMFGMSAFPTTSTAYDVELAGARMTNIEFKSDD